jgi:hypothetical protein
MKRIFIFMALAFFGTVSAQQPNQQINPSGPQVTPAIAPQQTTPARVDPKKQSEKDLEAEKLAKEKSHSQKQTKTQPNGLPPNLTDTINPPKKPKQPIIQ